MCVGVCWFKGETENIDEQLVYGLQYFLNMKKNNFDEIDCFNKS